MLPLDGRPARTDRCLGKDLGEEYLFYDPVDDRVHVLNAAAREILLLCEGSRSVGAIIGRFQRRYDADEETIRRDVAGMLERLIDLGLVRLDPQASTGGS